jgi:hypothetical protein
MTAPGLTKNASSSPASARVTTGSLPNLKATDAGEFALGDGVGGATPALEHLTSSRATALRAAMGVRIG